MKEIPSLQCCRLPMGRATRFSRFAAALAVALAWTAIPATAQVGPKKADPGLKYIPADAHIVLSISLGQILKKSGYETLADLPGVKEQLAEIRKQSELAAKLLEAPELLGVDLDRPIHLFAKLTPSKDGPPSGWGGIVATPLSAKKFEQGLRDVVKEAAGLAGTKVLQQLRVEGGWNILDPEEAQGAASLSFNDEAIIIVGADPTREGSPKAPQLAVGVRGGKQPLGKAEATFAGYLRNNPDAGGWMNFNSLMELAPDIPGEQLKKMRELLGNLRMAGAVNFLAGSIRADVLYSSDSDWLKKFGKSGPKKTLLNLVPQKAVASGVYSFDMDASRKWMKEEYLPALKNFGGPEGQQGFAFLEIMLMGATGLGVNDFIDMLGNEMMFTFVDLKKVGNEGPPKPSLLLGLTIADDAKLGKLMAKLNEGEALKAMRGEGFDIVHQKGRLFIGSEGMINVAKLGRVPGAVEGAQRGFFDKNDMALAVDFDLITRLAQDFDAPDEAINALRRFSRFEVTGNWKQDHFSYGIELLFRDKQKNALRQILDLAREVRGAGDEPPPKPQARPKGIEKN